jgi:hypothetical protein
LGFYPVLEQNKPAGWTYEQSPENAIDRAARAWYNYDWFFRMQKLIVSIRQDFLAGKGAPEVFSNNMRVL